MKESERIAFAMGQIDALMTAVVTLMAEQDPETLRARLEMAFESRQAMNEAQSSPRPVPESFLDGVKAMRDNLQQVAAKL